MSAIVVYYSGKGSNRFLASKAGEELKCEVVELKPRAPGAVLLATATKISFGNKALKNDFSSYDRVVLCGPLYMGSVAAPCNDFIRKYGKKIKTIDMITCCASTDEKKDDTFGYGKVFAKLKQRLGSKIGEVEAFPVELLLPEDQKDNSDAMMSTRMNESNFSGTIKERLDSFVAKIK